MDKKSILLAITGLFIFLTAFAQRSEDRKEYIEKKYTFFFPAGRAEIINGGTYTTTNDVNIKDTWAYCVNILNGAKLTLTEDHSLVTMV